VIKVVLQNTWKIFTCKGFLITLVNIVEKYSDRETTCTLIFPEHIKIPTEIEINI